MATHQNRLDARQKADQPASAPPFEPTAASLALRASPPASALRRPMLLMLVSTSGASARRAATVAFSLGRCLNGSNEKHRMAFSCVILLISSPGTPETAFHSSSAGFGHVESECG